MKKEYDTEVINGIEINYTTDCELYHICDWDKGYYDSKIDIHPDHTDSYDSNDCYWIEHNYIYHTDNEIKICHEMEERPWKTRCRS